MRPSEEGYRDATVDEAVIAEIRERVGIGDFELDRAHCDYHMGHEGFSLRDAVDAVAMGDMIDPTPDRNRWLFCGKVISLVDNPRYRGRWLHVSVEYDDDTAITLVTMYRPLTTEWRTERARR